MKEHFCPAERSTITYQGECSWCGESEGSMTQEALKLALEALEYWDVHGKLHQPTEEAITAIKKALAQTQEPVAWWVTSPDGEIDWSDEPIQYKEQRPLEELVDGCGYAPLYTHPPQRTWVDLTNDEIALIHADNPHPQGFARAILAKSKEKNT